MRIATSTLYTSSVAAMDQQTGTINQLQQQISTGLAVNTPADNPVAAAHAVSVNLQIATNTDQATNRQTAEASLNTVGTTLSSVTSLLTSVQSELVAAGDGTYSASERQTLATQLQGQMQDLMNYANTQDSNGEYLFAGNRVNTLPFVQGNFVSSSASPSNTGSGSLDAGSSALPAAFPATAAVTITSYTAPATPGGEPSFTYNVTGLPGGDVTGASSSNGELSAGGATLTLNGAPAVGDTFYLSPSPTLYQGDAGVRTVDVANGRSMAVSVSGAALFDSVPTGNGSYVTSAASGNSGSGLISAGTVTSPTALTHDQYAVQFSGTAAVTAGTGNTGKAAVDSSTITGTPTTQDSYTLSFAVSGGTTSYTVTDNATGQALQSAQPYTSGAPISFNGVSFNMGGAPADGDRFTVAPGPATHYSVQDLTTGASVLANQTYTSGAAIAFGGMSFTITGAPAANDQFKVDPAGTTSVFAVMQHAIDALKGSTTGAQSATVLANALSAANTGIQSAQQQTLLNATTIGGRQQELASLDTSQSQLKIQYQQTLSQLIDVDYTSAISNLSQAEVSLTAAQKSFAQIANLSLFNYVQ